jgi:hypothetical protein
MTDRVVGKGSYGGACYISEIQTNASLMIIIFWEMTPCGSYLPEDDNHHSHRRGNLKSYKR